MSDAPFIKFFPSDFLGGVGGLSPAERGVYITVLCLIWDNDGPIEYDEARLARRCGAPKAAFKKTIEALIDLGKLFLENGRLANERAEKSLMDRRNRIKSATIAVNARWSAQKEKIERNQCEKDTAELPPQYVDDTNPEARSQNIGGGGSAGARDPENPSPDHPTFRERILEAMGAPGGVVGASKFVGGQGDVAEAMRWLDLPGITEDVAVRQVAETAAAKADGPARSFRYFTPAMQRLSSQMSAAPLRPDAAMARASPQPTRHLWKLGPEELEKFNDDGSRRQ